MAMITSSPYASYHAGLFPCTFSLTAQAISFIIIPILEMKQPRLRKAQYLVHSCSAGGRAQRWVRPREVWPLTSLSCFPGE